MIYEAASTHRALLWWCLGVSCCGSGEPARARCSAVQAVCRCREWLVGARCAWAVTLGETLGWGELSREVSGWKRGERAVTGEFETSFLACDDRLHFSRADYM